MGLFAKLLAAFSGKTVPAFNPPVASEREPAASPPAQYVSRPLVEVSITATFSGLDDYVYPVKEESVTKGLSRHNHVLEREFPPLKTADRWWDEASHKRRLKQGSDKALAWATPFVPMEVAGSERVRGFRESGPFGASRTAKELRAVIREKRKAKEPHEQLLRGLYGVAVLADFVAELEFEGVQPHVMVQYVDINQLRAIQLDFAELGYLEVRSLSMTDVKWLVEAFGEPAKHMAFDDRWPAVRRNAVARYCWGDLGVAAQGASPERRVELMREYLELRVRVNLKYRGEPGSGPPPGLQAPAARQSWIEVAPVDDAATQSPFVVADLETTGLSPDDDEILELAAVFVEPGGAVVREFAMLVKAQQPVPSEITQLTGITQAEVDSLGRPLAEAYSAFCSFVGDRPVFFHNAPFDLAFIARAAARTGIRFENRVHDTLQLARIAWPSLRNHKLGTLARHIGREEPQHRALGDAKAALAVLLAAQEIGRASRHAGRRQ